MILFELGYMLEVSHLVVETTVFNLQNTLIVCLILFGIGVFGVLSKRNILVVLMSIEIMLNAVNLAFLAFNYFNFYGTGNETGQYFVLLVIAVAAAEAAVGLAILVAIHKQKKSVDTESLLEMKG